MVLKLLAASVPYVAVLLGMYVFNSAWLAILLYHAGIIGFLVWRKPPNLWKKLWGGYKTPLLVPGVLICAMACPVVYFMWPLLSVSDSALPEWLAHYGLTGISWLLMIPYFSIVHPMMEEVYWRGLAPDPVKGLTWLDFAFAGYHVVVLCQLIKAPWLLFIFAVLMGSSVFWRWATDRFGGFGLPLLTHAAADAGVVMGAHLLLR